MNDVFGCFVRRQRSPQKMAFLFLLAWSFMGPLTALAAGDATKGKELFQSKCITCHGQNGEGNPAQKAPRLAGQHAWYIVTQLKNFTEGVRSNPPMLPYIKGLSGQDFEDLAAHLSQLK